MDNNVTTQDKKESVSWKKINSRMIRNELAAVFHMACHNSTLHYNTFVEYTECLHLARFVIGRGSRAEYPLPAYSYLSELKWTYYEQEKMEGNPCIMICRYNSNGDPVVEPDAWSQSHSSKTIYLDTQDQEVIKERLKEAIDFIRMHLKDGFDIEV